MIRVLFSASLASVLCVSPGWAQTTAGINAGIQFDFSLPGARSLGMGGSFVAMADDSTASLSNPAGLMLLVRPEISVEGRVWNFYSLLPDRGHAFGTPTGVGTDTVATLSDRELKDSTASPSFVSFVYPRGDWAVAGYRHQFSNFRNRTETEGPFFTYPNGDVARINPNTNIIDLDIVSYGGSVARRVSRDVSVGIAIAYSRFSLNSYAEAYLLSPHGTILTPAQRPLWTGAGEAFGTADLSASNVLVTERQFGDDSGFSVNLGVLWRISEQWTVGGAFRQGPRFEFSSEFGRGPALQRMNPGTALLDSDEGIAFHTPHSYAAGVVYAPGDRLRLAAEYSFVPYTRLLNGDGSGRPVETAGRLQADDPAIREEGQAIVEGLTINDAHQLRVGAEWIVAVAPRPIAVRVGGWYDPDHRVRFEDTAGAVNRIQELTRQRVLFPNGSDEFHLSAGFGIALSQAVRFDTAVDFSPRVNTFSASMVYYFR